MLLLFSYLSVLHSLLSFLKKTNQMEREEDRLSLNEVLGQTAILVQIAVPKSFPYGNQEHYCKELVFEKEKHELLMFVPAQKEEEKGFGFKKVKEFDIFKLVFMKYSLLSNV